MSSQATKKGDIERITVPGQSRQKCLWDPISLGKENIVVVCTCHPVTTGSIKQEDSISGQPEQKARHYLQHNQSKNVWRCGSSDRTLT
jgi:hypothetical protein